jgi:Prion-inhibition and propagation
VCELDTGFRNYWLLMDIISLLLGIGSVFPVCVQGYRILTSVKNFPNESLSLFWKLKTQDLRFTTWGQAYGFREEDRDGGGAPFGPTVQNNNHSRRVFQLTHGVLLAMQETLSDVDRLMTQYSLEVLDQALLDRAATNKGSTLAILRFRRAIRDKKAFKTLILDLKDFNDGLCATLTPLVQGNVDSSVNSQVTAAAGRIDDLQAIQDAASDFEMLRNTVSFKTFNLAIQSQPHFEASPEPQLEIPLSELRIDTDGDPSSLGLCLAVWRTYYAVVEWKYYEANEGLRIGSPSANSVKRIHRLVQLLANPSKPKDFQVLDCIGYTHDRFHARLGIGFRILEGSKAPMIRGIKTSKSRIWINLADLIEQGPKMPLLGQRMQLALTLTKSMIQLAPQGLRVKERHLLPR